MKLVVRVAQRALKDVEQIVTWVAERSPQGAVQWFERYLKMLQQLPLWADGCETAFESDLLGSDLKQLSFKT